MISLCKLRGKVRQNCHISMRDGGILEHESGRRWQSSALAQREAELCGNGTSAR